MEPLLEQALRNPYAALSLVLGDTLHPGGEEATRDLLERAGIEEGQRVLDLGCGTGVAGRLARELGAEPIGLDRDPEAAGASVCARIEQLPIADGSVDVVLSECALCLAEDLPATLAEVRRVLGPGGRLAFSDVTVTREIEHLPASVAEALCLTGQRSPSHLQDALGEAGFRILDVRDHHEDLLAMREEVRGKVDYRGLLGAMGSRGSALLVGIDEAEAALEARELGYVSVVAQVGTDRGAAGAPTPDR